MSIIISSRYEDLAVRRPTATESSFRTLRNFPTRQVNPLSNHLSKDPNLTAKLGRSSARAVRSSCKTIRYIVLYHLRLIMIVSNHNLRRQEKYSKIKLRQGISQHTPPSWTPQKNRVTRRIMAAWAAGPIYRVQHQAILWWPSIKRWWPSDVKVTCCNSRLTFCSGKSVLQRWLPKTVCRGISRRRCLHLRATSFHFINPW